MIVGDGPLAHAIRAHAGDTDWCWIAYDDATIEDVTLAIKAQMPTRLVILTTPMPVGTCRLLERAFTRVDFAVVPENVRAAHAEHDWTHQARYILGTRKPQPYLHSYLHRLAPVIEMSPESAEMVKHALNSFLALQIRFGNELGRICERFGADSGDVVKGLISDPRIGAGYFTPGSEPGPHLMREVGRLRNLGFRVSL